MEKVYIVMRNDGLFNRDEGETQVGDVYTTKEVALAYAKKFAQEDANDSGLIVGETERGYKVYDEDDGEMVYNYYPVSCDLIGSIII